LSPTRTKRPALRSSPRPPPGTHSHVNASTLYNSVLFSPSLAHVIPVDPAPPPPRDVSFSVPPSSFPIFGTRSSVVIAAIYDETHTTTVVKTALSFLPSTGHAFHCVPPHMFPLKTTPHGVTPVNPAAAAYPYPYATPYPYRYPTTHPPLPTPYSRFRNRNHGITMVLLDMAPRSINPGLSILFHAIGNQLLLR
ncbi:unnamed protein product, partial [Ectocarpus fasciculatus]